MVKIAVFETAQIDINIGEPSTCTTYINEPKHRTTNERAFALSEDSDHPVIPASRNRVFAVRFMGS